MRCYQIQIETGSTATVIDTWAVVFESNTAADRDTEFEARKGGPLRMRKADVDVIEDTHDPLADTQEA